jgi:hypothetical protein
MHLRGWAGVVLPSWVRQASDNHSQKKVQPHSEARRRTALNSLFRKILPATR